MARPTPEQVATAERRFGSWPEAEDWAEQQPAMDTAHIWGRDMSYTERVWTIVKPACAAPGETSLRDPLPVPETIRVLELRLVEQLSWSEIEQSVSLSHRKVDYIRKAILHDDLGWDEAGNCPAFGPLTRNTRAGIVLPRR